MLLSNKTFSIECYSETSVNCVLCSVVILYPFSTPLYFIINFMFFTFIPCCMCVCHMCITVPILTNLLTYVIDSWTLVTHFWHGAGNKSSHAVKYQIVYTVYRFRGFELRSAPSNPGARFTKYLATILRLSYDNAKVTIDLRRTSNLQNIQRRAQGFSSVRFTRKVVRSSETVFAN